jgi:HNH endonuclease
MINQDIERIRLLIAELEEDSARISLKADDLKQAIEAVTDASSELGGGDESQGLVGAAQRLTIGIPNIEKKNDEAIFDAMAEFNKMCPYCGKNQYHLGYRDKIEIDHFFPVSKGGQHVPWNILPVCKDCNRKKRDKAPRDYLSPEVFQRCNEYLMRVKQRYHEEGIQQIEGSVKLKSLIDENLDFLKNNSSERFISELLHIFYPEKLMEFYGIHDNVCSFTRHDDPIDIRSVKVDLIELGLRPHERFVREWVTGFLPLPLRVCSTEQLYRAFTRWAQASGERFPPPQVVFSKGVEKAGGGKLRPD